MSFFSLGISASTRKFLAVLSGPLLGGIIFLMPSSLEPDGQASLSVLVFCACWWLFGAVPLPVTSLVGLGLLPALGALSVSDALSLFGNQAVFFVVGIFIISSVLLKTGISERFALMGLKRFGSSENSLCWAVLLFSWGLCSITVSHAVAALLLPIILRIIHSLELAFQSKLSKRLLLSMAWGTICGSNIGMLSSARASLALELYDEYGSGQKIGMLDYSLATVPVALLSVLIAGIVLQWLFPSTNVSIQPALESIQEKIEAQGAFSKIQLLVCLLLIGMILTMVVLGASYLGIIALLFTGVFFAFQLISWEEAEKTVNWGVVLLYGGAIAVGSAVHKTGASYWLVERVFPEMTSSIGILLFGIAILTAVFTELLSNSAVIAIILPMGLAIAEQQGIDARIIAIMIPVCAGLAFVLPTSTPAMAMVFGTGYLRTNDTICGVLISFLSIIGFLGIVYFLWSSLGIDVDLLGGNHE